MINNWSIFISDTVKFEGNIFSDSFDSPYIVIEPVAYIIPGLLESVVDGLNGLGRFIEIDVKGFHGNCLISCRLRPSDRGSGIEDKIGDIRGLLFFMAHGAVRPIAVIVVGPDAGIILEPKEFSLEAPDETVERSAFPIGASGVAHEQGVAGKQMPGHQVLLRVLPRRG